jgi:hypothetical protein
MKIKIDVILYGIEPNDSIRIFRNESTIGYCFINSGNTPITINNFVLLPNTTWKTFEPMCEDLTVYRASFNQSNNLYSSCGTNNSNLTAIIYSKV